MTDDLSTQIMSRKPSADRPLQGLTVLVVEDSRFASEAMRLLCLRSGARIRRADCLASAHRHLAVYRPSAVIVDLGLPDGSGATLIREIAHSDQPVPVLLGTSGDDAAEEVATRAGAQGFLRKPITSLATFQHAILSRFPGPVTPNCLRLVSADRVTPDPLALREDLCHVAEILSAPMTRQKLDYVRQFLSSVAFSASDDKLARAANRLCWEKLSEPKARATLAEVTGLVEMRMTGTGAF